MVGQAIKLTNRIVQYNKLEKAMGVYVVEVDHNKGIQNSELFPGDIVVGFNGRNISSIDDLHRMMDENVIGKKISLSVLRKGIAQEISVVPAELK
jgi:S1-C subfamily serine protease